MKELSLSGAHGWVKHRLKDVFSFRSGDTISADDIHDLDDVNCYPVYGGNGIRGYYSKFNSEGEYPLIGRQGALCGNVNFASGFFWATEHAVRVKGKKLVSIRWAMRLLEDMDLNQYATQSAQPGLSVEKVKPLYVFVPPVSEQKAIADFLDRETALIDKRLALIEKKRALLSELKKSVIHEAVTKGMDNSVVMKDSGVEWIGDIPTNWRVLRGKDIFEKVSLPANDSDEIVTCFRDGVVTQRKNRREDGFTIALKEHGYQGIRPGNLAIHAMDAFAGAIGVSESSGKCSPVISVCKARDGSFSMWFLAYALRSLSMTGYIQSVAKGIRERSTDFRFSQAEATFFAVPSLCEQNKIVNYIEERCLKIEKILSLLSVQKKLLQEQRQAMINEVVTGKRRVI